MSLGSCLWNLPNSESRCYKVNPSSAPILSCPSQTFYDSISKTCISCYPGCLECVNGAINGCTACYPTFVLVDGACTCPTWAIVDPASGTCISKRISSYSLTLTQFNFIVNCNIENCNECYLFTSNASSNTSVRCLQCNTGYYYLNTTNTCTQVCPEGYEANDTTRTCVQKNCSTYCYNCQDCASCANITHCSVCQGSLLLENGMCVTQCVTHPVSVNGVCVDSCPPGYGAQNQGASISCVPCDSNCETCSESSYNTCLTCSSSRYLSNGTCFECDTSCTGCSNNAYNCTSCSEGYYSLPEGPSTCVSSCPLTYYLNHENQTCLKCSEPMTLTETGDYIYCGGNCQLCSDSGICLQCEPGLQLSDGYCTIPGMRSSARFNFGIIKSLTALSVLKHFTSQAITVEFPQTIKTSSNLEIVWLLYARDIATDYLSLSCEDIEAVFESNNHEFPSSVFQVGVHGFQYLNYTQSNGIYLNFSGLRAGIVYNYTICVKESHTEIWDSESLDFKTKDNGYQIQKVSITTDIDLPQSEVANFLCALSSSMNVSNSTILTTEGISCGNSDEAVGRRRNLDDHNVRELPQVEHPPVGSKLRLMTTVNKYQGTQLDLFIYGNAHSEQLDQTPSLLVSLLTSTGFTQAFEYHSQSLASPIKISHVSAKGEVLLVPPVINTVGISYETKGNTIFFPSLTASGTNGYFYVYLIPHNTSRSELKDLPSSSAIIYSLNTNSLLNDDEVIVRRLLFFDGEATTAKIDGIKTGITYSVMVFATNEDVSQFALRTPRSLLQAVTGIMFPAASREISTLIFLILECSAILFIIFAWHSLISPLKICRLFKKLRKQSKPTICEPQTVLAPKEFVKENSLQKSATIDVSLENSFKVIKPKRVSLERVPLSSAVLALSAVHSSERTIPSPNALTSIDLPKITEKTYVKGTSDVIKLDEQGSPKFITFRLNDIKNSRYL